MNQTGGLPASVDVGLGDFITASPAAERSKLEDPAAQFVEEVEQESYLRDWFLVD